MAYTVNQPQYPDINNAKPDFYAMRMVVPGLYSGAMPIGLTAITFGDKLEKGKLRGNAQYLLAKGRGKYTVADPTLEMYMDDFYLGLLPFLGNLGQPLGLGAYEVAFNLQFVFSTPNSPYPKRVQINGASIGSVDEDQKESQDPLKVKVKLDEPFQLLRNGVVPAATDAAIWPTNAT